jgi:GAF domain-containing protein
MDFPGMTALPQDAVADLQQRIAELERQLETAVNERDAAIDRQTASALVNFRLKNELRAVTDRQKASAEILNTIANTQGDAEHALQQIAETTATFFNAAGVTIRIAEGDEWVQGLRVGASSQLTGGQAAAQSTARGVNLPATVYRDNRQIHIPDLDNIDPSMADWPATAARAAGIRTICGTPLRRDSKAIGALIVYRDRLAAFNDDDLALQQSFADQAVIAIENARLFNETQESLRQQTATAGVLGVIASSPTDVKPVLDAIVESACKLCEASDAYLALKDSDYLVFQAHHGSIPVAWERRPINRQWPSGRAVLDGNTLHLRDILASGDEFPDAREIALRDGARTVLTVPLMREGESIGVIILRRTEVLPFTDKQIALLKTFADQAVIAIENARLFNETQEALARQTATAEILKVIASSPSDVQPVFDVIVERAVRLCGGRMGRVYRYDSGVIQMVAGHGLSATGLGKVQQVFPRPATDDTIAGQVMLSHQPYFVTDIQHEDSVPALSRQMIEALGTRSQVTVPMLRTGQAIGAITVGWADPGAFGNQQVSLLQTFADQAVIAIENVRLFKETQEALERQTATADILKVIASSPSDVQPVFEAIAASANRLIGGFSTAVHRVIDDIVHLVAFTPTNPEADEALQAAFPRHRNEVPTAGLVQNGESAQIADAETADPQTKRLSRARGWRSVTFTPLMNQGIFIGFIACTRLQKGVLAEHHVQLLRTFADQAVIAIENTRLFNETQQALERQTATADILKVIASSPSDVQPVFEAIAASANRLLGGFSSTVFRFIDGMAHLEAFTPTTPEADEVLSSSFPVPVTAFAPFRTIQSGEMAQIPDTEAVDYELKEIARARGYRSMLWAPLLNKGVSIGMIAVTRLQAGGFADHHVQLLRTFADQAVIAIENTRLFNETQEALARQTATSDILRVISGSPTDVQPVFDAIVQTTVRLLGCETSFIQRCDSTHFWTVARCTKEGLVPVFESRHAPIDPSANFPSRAIVAKQTLYLPDWSEIELPEFERRIQRGLGYNSAIYLPLLREGECIGILGIAGSRPRMFSEADIALAESFSDQALIAIENTRLFNETQEALERQTATADILKVIASSPSDVQPVFEAIVNSGAKLFEPCAATITTLKDGELHWNATAALLPGFDVARTRAVYPLPFDPERSPSSRAILERRVIEIPDIQSPDTPEFTRNAAAAGGFRSITFVPLVDQHQGIGTIIFTHQQPGFKFSEKQLALVQTFADQAVIAIQNTRLFNETQQALERQTATADILKVIASSPSDTKPVFEAIAGSAKRLLGGLSAAVFRIIDGTVHVAAFTPINPAADAALNADFPRPVEEFEGFRFARDGKPFSIPDTEERTGTLRDVARLHGFRSMLYVPLMNGAVPFGVITVTRVEPGGFPPHHIQLLQTFADQAVIAIENTRLFNEVQERTIELTEALEQQTATAEVLGVISSSAGDLAPVFDAMLGKAMQLCSANFGVLNTYDGKKFHTAATYGLPPAYDEYRRRQPLEYGPATAPARLLEGEPFVQTTDLPESEAYRNGEPNRRALVDIGGARCLLAVPLLKDGCVVGDVMIFRQENRPFSEKQITLLTQFAAQAVIAIENTRLLRELRESTEDLTESLQQQTATSEVLQIISASPGDLAPVFDKMLENATRVCGAQFGSMLLVEDQSVRQAALYNAPPALAEVRVDRVFRPHPQSALAAALRTRQVCQVEDLRTQPNYLERNPATVEFVELGGVRTAAWVPMIRNDEAIGVITIYRQEVHPFDDKQIDLVRNFAKQAVIAIENARLLRELRQRTDDLTESLQFQTASAEVLKVISRSPDALQPVFDVIVETSRELCRAQASTIFALRDGRFHVVAFEGTQTDVLQHMRDHPIALEQKGSALARAAREKRTIHIPNTHDDPEFAEGSVIGIGEPRATLSVPLMRESEVIGGITLRQSHVTPFTARQIEAIESFADQAVIAISNVNLFEQVQQRTRELTKSLDDLRTAQDRLIQTEKLASLGQLTAGIAHEIKNPLNFVNNFAALSAELTDELKDVLKPAVLDETIRAEVDEVTGMLKDNLSRVVQHGKRADSIVKNMLLHSREGSGEHRPADVNALVDESLNLAYHGARAEKPQFNVTLRRDFDPQAGQVEVFPQEITRVLLNLISNGFYAVTRRKAENGGAEFEPQVTATTRGSDDHVEIRIRDNGTGIPPEVKDKMFNPFFTTKPAGEGTGLGLSMSHDIIVKQHGGTIEVETEPGAFTEFRLVLPRTSRANGSR